jgi:hypothetical protein
VGATRTATATIATTAAANATTAGRAQRSAAGQSAAAQVRADVPRDREDFDPDAEEEIDHSRIPNPLEQTFDKRFVQNPRSSVGGRGFRSGGGGFGAGGSAPAPKKGGGPKEPDPLQTSVGYIGADAFHRKGGRGGGAVAATGAAAVGAAVVVLAAADAAALRNSPAVRLSNPLTRGREGSSVTMQGFAKTLISGEKNMALERTLSIIKPDAVAKNVIGQIYGRFEGRRPESRRAKMAHLSRGEARPFYAVHKARPVLQRPREFMISGPVMIQSAGRRQRDREEPRADGRNRSEEGREGHDPRRLRRQHRRQRGARLRRPRTARSRWRSSSRR